MQQLFSRVFGQLSQRMLVDTLANSRTFQRMAVRTNEATQAAKATAQQKAAEVAAQAVESAGGRNVLNAGDTVVKEAGKSFERFFDGVVRYFCRFSRTMRRVSGEEGFRAQIEWRRG